MWAAEPARTLFTSPRWDCRFWALTWLRRPWRSPERRPTTVGSRSSSLRLTRSSWSVWGARLRTVLDCGLFHTFDGDERPGYVASLASVTEHDGTLYCPLSCLELVPGLRARRIELHGFVENFGGKSATDGNSLTDAEARED